MGSTLKAGSNKALAPSQAAVSHGAILAMDAMPFKIKYCGATAWPQPVCSCRRVNQSTQATWGWR